jgi:hypothetical protein
MVGKLFAGAAGRGLMRIIDFAVLQQYAPRLKSGVYT